jgi:hypothetical protein
MFFECVVMQNAKKKNWMGIQGVMHVCSLCIGSIVISRSAKITLVGCQENSLSCIIAEIFDSGLGQCAAQIESEQCIGACLIPIWSPESSAKGSPGGIDQFKIARLLQNISLEWPHAITAQCVTQRSQISVVEHIWSQFEAPVPGIDQFKIARPLQNIWPEWPHAIMAQCVTQIVSDQSSGACLIPIWGCEPSAEASAEGINNFEIGRHLWNIWPEWPHTIMAQCVTQIESDQSGGACLIPISGPDPSAKCSMEGINHSKNTKIEMLHHTINGLYIGPRIQSRLICTYNGKVLKWKHHAQGNWFRPQYTTYKKHMARDIYNSFIHSLASTT